MLLTRTQIRRLVYAHGREILEHDHMAIERVCYQHGVVTTFAHSIRVACLSVWLADRLHLWNRVDLHSLIRAALLHDYFLTIGMTGTTAPIGYTDSHMGKRPCATPYGISNSTRSNGTASNITCSH